MNKLPIEKRAQILGMLVEGNSMRSASRMADVSINTVSKLLVDVGSACGAFQDLALRNLPCKRIQVDEIWSFVYSKQRNVPESNYAHGYAPLYQANKCFQQESRKSRPCDSAAFHVLQFWANS